MENVLLTKYIETTPHVRGGKPRLTGTRITVSDIVILYLKLGQTIDEIANDYNLSLAAIHSALAYYYDHQAEIENQLTEDDAFVEAFRRQNPSRLQAKLRQLRGE